MRAIHRSIIVAALLMGGCSLVVDGEVGDLDINLNAKRDISIALINFTAHIGQRVDVRIVRPSGAEGTIQARAMFDPLPTECVEVRMARGASAAATRVDFYADLNGDGVLSPPGDDHTWRRALDEMGELRFVHDVEFDDISAPEATTTGQALSLSLTGLDAFDGETLVASVIRDDFVAEGEPTRETIPGVLVHGPITGGALDVILPGIIDAGEEHQIEVNIGEGATVCRAFLVAPTSGDLMIAGEFATAFPDCTGAAHDVFSDCTP